MTKLYGVLIAAAALAACGAGAAPSGSPGNPTVEQIAGATKQTQASIDAGYIKKIDCATHEAQVTAAFWKVLDAEGKKGFTMSLAWRCEGEQLGNRVTVVDSQSGKTLATFLAGDYTVQ